MKRLLLVIVLLAVLAPWTRADQAAHGFCEVGAQPVVTSGLTSTTQVQQSFPACTVTVFIHGGGLATIFSDNGITPLSNPFTATSNGQWTFYAANGHYDIQMSGAGFPSPVTISDFLLNDSSGGGGGGSPGGSPVQAQFNNTGVFGGSPCASVPNAAALATGPLNLDCDNHSKGPNPNVDITRYGARASSPSSAPNIPGITATMSASSNAVTLSSASTFQNNDWVVIWGAGLTCPLSTPSAPTVTPSNAASLVETGINVASPAAGTSYAYEIVARDTFGCLTAASSAGSTATGQSSLGAQSLAITSQARSNFTVTVTVGSTAALSTGTLIHIFNPSNNNQDFSGWYIINSVPNGTTFTYLSNADQRTGAATSSTGGTIFYWNNNHITWTGTSSALAYYIYGPSCPGTCNLLGESKPNNTASQDFTWDDFGSTMMGNFTFPAYVPSTAPASALPDPLYAQIVSGAGSTTLNLSASSTNAVSGQTILKDDGQAILAAANAVRGSLLGNEVVYIPAPITPSQFVVNSFVQMPNIVTTKQTGPLTLNETLELTSNDQWVGECSAGGFSFSIGMGCSVNIINANPGFFISNPNTVLVENVFFSNNSNAAIEMFIEEGQYINLHKLGFIFNSANNLTGIGLATRGLNTNTTFPLFANKLSFETAAQSTGATSTPMFLCNYCGSMRIDDMSIQSRGMAFNGPNLDVRHVYSQAPQTPIISTYVQQGSTVKIEDISEDTGSSPIYAALGPATFTYNLALKNVYNGPGSDGNGAPPGIGGQPWVAVYSDNTLNLNFADQVNTVQSQTAQNITDGFFVTNGNSSGFATQVTHYNSLFNVGAGYSLFTTAATAAAPTCVVNTAGPPFTPAGTYTFEIGFTFPSGGYSKPGLPSTSCTANGTTQQIVITPATLNVPGATGWLLYLATGGAYIQFQTAPFSLFSPSFTMTSGCSNCSSAPTQAGAGPAGMQAGLVWGGNVDGSAFSTTTNCNVNTVSPAACLAAPAGVVVVPTTTTTYTVNTTVVTNNSHIFVVPRTDNTGVSGAPTCNAPPTGFIALVSGRTAGTSFTFTLPSTTGTSCWDFWVVD